MTTSNAAFHPMWNQLIEESVGQGERRQVYLYMAHLNNKAIQSALQNTNII